MRHTGWRWEELAERPRRWPSPKRRPPRPEPRDDVVQGRTSSGAEPGCAVETVPTYIPASAGIEAESAGGR